MILTFLSNTDLLNTEDLLKDNNYRFQIVKNGVSKDCGHAMIINDYYGYREEVLDLLKINNIQFKVYGEN